MNEDKFNSISVPNSNELSSSFCACIDFQIFIMKLVKYSHVVYSKRYDYKK